MTESAADFPHLRLAMIGGRLEANNIAVFGGMRTRCQGHMVVLEQGRNNGKSRPTPRFNKRGKQTRRSKWNGRTSGKHTWSDATALMQKRVGKRVDEQVQKSIGKFIKG